MHAGILTLKALAKSQWLHDLWNSFRVQNKGLYFHPGLVPNAGLKLANAFGVNSNCITIDPN